MKLDHPLVYNLLSAVMKQISQLVIGAQQYTATPTSATYGVRIETMPPGGGTFANPIERFPDLRVCNSIAISMESPENRGMDGGIEPALALFEPLIPGTDHYYLPWLIPEGLILKDERDWEGWDAWLGNDNDSIDDCQLEFLKVTTESITIRWTGSLGKDKPFEFNGNLEITPITMYADKDADISLTLTRLFGETQASMLLINATPVKDSRYIGWHKYEFTPKI